MLKNICEQYDATTIQQLYKIITDNESGGYKNKNVFPVSLIQSIFDGITGIRLDQILSLFNCIYIPFKGTKEDTRLSVNADIRRKGLIITFRDLDNITYTQRYTYDNSIADDYWKDDKNWEECFTSINNSDFINIIKEYITDYINENLIKVIDNLNSDDTTSALSAKQGKVLKNLIDNLQSIKFSVVNELPEQGDSNIIYLVSVSDTVNNKYEEYIWIENNNEYEKLGAIETTIDLSNYITTDELNSTLINYITSETLNNTLKTYVTLQTVTDTLNNYITNDNLTSILANYVNTKKLNDAIVTKQDILVSGVNIKTINKNSIVGKGDISINIDPYIINYLNDLNGSVSMQQYNELKTAINDDKIIVISVLGFDLLVINKYISGNDITIRAFNKGKLWSWRINSDYSVEFSTINFITGPSQAPNNGDVLTYEDGNIWKTPTKELPINGTVGQVLTKTEDGVAWADNEAGDSYPSGGTVGQVLKKTANGVDWEDDLNTTYTNATTTTDGLMSKEDKSKLDNIAGIKTKLLTKEEYEALETKDSDTIYFLKE